MKTISKDVHKNLLSDLRKNSFRKLNLFGMEESYRVKSLIANILGLFNSKAKQHDY